MQTTKNIEAQVIPVEQPQAVAHSSLVQETYKLVTHLGDVLGLRSGEQVLLLPGDLGMTGLTLAQNFDAQVTVVTSAPSAVEPTDPRLRVEHGSITALPFADGTFDAVIVVAPVTSALLPAARELARVLRRTGRLGLVALSPYRDQVGEDAAVEFLQAPVMTLARPAAAYRAVLGEAGFTAFLYEDRRRAVRQSAAAIFREHILRDEPQDTTLGLLASGGLNVTLITAEKAL